MTVHITNISARLLFIVLTACSIFAAPRYCAAQAVPDTSLNNIISDTVHQKKAGPDIQMFHGQAKPPTDTTDGKPKRFQPNPKKAGLYSAIVPGLGQLYNRQYWKIPVVYLGVAVAGYYFVDNLNQYQSYRKAYIGRINNPYPTDKYVGLYNTGELQQLQNDYSKYLDMTALFSVIGYALQVMDAVTAAHLKNFDISRDISMRMVPVATPNGAGLGLVMNFK